MSEAFVLIGSAPGHTEEVLAYLRDLAPVRAARRVAFGHFDVLARIEAPTHLAVQHLITDKLRFHAGVERVEEIGDAEEAAGTLHAIDAAGA